MSVGTASSSTKNLESLFGIELRLRILRSLQLLIANLTARGHKQLEWKHLLETPRLGNS